MSVSSANLQGVLSVRVCLTSNEADRLRSRWREQHNAYRAIILEAGTKFEPQPLDDDLYALMCRAQDRFKSPHERWAWCQRLPVPFRWGPNGAFLLLVLMLTVYAATVVLWLRFAA